MDKFIKEDLEFFLPDSFKGLSKDYILNAIFNKKIQNKWVPKVGDIIVGCTGNVFVISGKHDLHEDLGGVLFFFGGGLCNRDGGNILNSTYCSTLNKDGKYYSYTENGIVAKKQPHHSSWKEFRFVPYPHELQN